MRRSPRSSPRRALRRPVRSLAIAAIVLALAALVAAGWPRPAAAATAPLPPTVSAKAYVVMDQQTGVVLAQKNSSERLPMASTTKIMTGLLVLEHFRDLSTVIKAPRDAVGVGEDEIYLVKGEKLTVDQLLQALLIQSANDAAADLADAVAGTQAKFVALMNAKAVALGLTNTHYANPHGLDAPGHYTSALDLTHLARIAMADPRFAGYVDHYTATIPWAHHSYRRVLVSHNELLEDYPWAYGVKTGWTDPAGYCIAAAGKWRGHRILVTLLGEPDDAQRLTDVVKLFHWSASQYAVRMVWPAGTALAQVTVPWHDGKLDLVTAAPITASLRIGAQVSSHVAAPGTVALPVTQGETLGQAQAYVDGHKIGAVRLVAAATFARVGLLGKISHQLHHAWHWVTSHL